MNNHITNQRGGVPANQPSPSDSGPAVFSFTPAAGAALQARGAAPSRVFDLVCNLCCFS